VSDRVQNGSVDKSGTAGAAELVSPYDAVMIIKHCAGSHRSSRSRHKAQHILALMNKHSWTVKTNYTSPGADRRFELQFTIEGLFSDDTEGYLVRLDADGSVLRIQDVAEVEVEPSVSDGGTKA
jgi:hypothetical protein